MRRTSTIGRRARCPSATDHARRPLNRLGFRARSSVEGVTRLPFITDHDLDDDQRAVWESVTNGLRGPSDRLITPDGGLAGPFNAALHAATTGRHVTALGEALRFRSEVEPRLLELAICTTWAHWRSNFEWFAHRPLAEKAGIEPAALDAIERGGTPDLTRDDEATVFALTRALLDHGRMDDDTYARATRHLGDRGVVEIVQAVGYYCLISFTLNAFEIDLPAGNEPLWPYATP